jgi:hypothetical protein
MSATISNQPIIGTKNFLDCAGRAQRRQRFWACGWRSMIMNRGACELAGEKQILKRRTF